MAGQGMREMSTILDFVYSPIMPKARFIGERSLPEPQSCCYDGVACKHDRFSLVGRREGSTMGQDVASSAGSSSISSTLLSQLQANRPEAWQRFVRLYSPMIYRWCRRSGVTADDAADVLQEVLAAVIRHVSDFRRDGPHDSFTAWLATLTRSKVSDHYRRRHGRAE